MDLRTQLRTDRELPDIFFAIFRRSVSLPMSVPNSLEAASPIGVNSRPELRPINLAQRIFSFPIVLGALLVLMMMFTIRSRFSDPDMWWHLKVGEIIWQTRSIPSVDLFSFTAYGHAWTAHEWLSELSMYAAWKLGGYTGLMLWFCVVASLLILAAYLLSTIYSGNCKVAFLGGAMVWLFSTIGLAIRPHLLGFLLLICELIVIQLGRTRNSRWFFALPPIFALWVNVHSSFIFGLVVLGITCAFSFVDFRLGLLSARRWLPEKRTMVAIAFGLSLVALFINPIGPKLVWYPVDVMLNEPINMGFIQEWQQISFSDFRGWALLCTAALILLVPLLRRLELEGSELVLTALSFAFAIQHSRMLFVFGILVAPILCRLLASSWDYYNPRRDSAWVSAVILALVIPLVVMAFPGSTLIDQQIQAKNPVRAVEFIRHSSLSGNMLNDYIFGGYLIWAAPERKVSMDGRADLYERAGVLERQEKWALLQADPGAFLDQYRIRICMLPSNATMTRIVPMLSGWKKVYSDEIAVVFAR